MVISFTLPKLTIVFTNEIWSKVPPQSHMASVLFYFSVLFLFLFCFQNLVTHTQQTESELAITAGSNIELQRLSKFPARYPRYYSAFVRKTANNGAMERLKDKTVFRCQDKRCKNRPHGAHTSRSSLWIWSTQIVCNFYFNTKKRNKIICEFYFIRKVVVVSKKSTKLWSSILYTYVLPGEGGGGGGGG